jgi:hypothetical protein
MKSAPKPLNVNPVQQAAAFTPPPTGIVTIAGLRKEPLRYWATIRIAWLSGYKINWVVPGREGSTSGSQSVWNLDTRIRPVFDIIPARTAKYELEPYVLVAGRPHIEPTLGTRVTVNATVTSTSARGRGVSVTAAPTGLGETARWLPTPPSYVAGVWSPQGAPVAPDDTLKWEGSEKNLPVLYNEFTYAKRGQWVTTTCMAVMSSSYFRLNGLSLYNGPTPRAPVTYFFVASISAPSKYWGSLLRAMESDASGPTSRDSPTNLDFRLMPDGFIHPYTMGWQEALPLVGENHALSLFGFTLDPAANTLRMFTIDRNLRFVDMGLPTPHSATSRFVLGRNDEALVTAYFLDIVYYRGPMSVERMTFIASELDAAYGITASPSQEQV